MRREIIGKSDLAQIQEVAGLFQVFDNMGPIPHHMHQNAKQAGSSARKANRSPTISRRSTTTSATIFPTRSWAWNPARPRPRCAAAWKIGTKATTASWILSRAYRLKPGTGWLIPPCILHAPGSLCTYEPQWGSDVFGMYQSLVEGREVPWSLLVKDVPKKYHHDLDYLVGPARWEGNTDPNFKDNHYLEPVPVADTSKRRLHGPMDRLWKVEGAQLFSAKELTVEPRATCTIRTTALTA